MSDGSGALYLTRNGSFTPDTSGNLVNSSGYYLMGQNVQNGVSPIAANSLTGLRKSTSSMPARPRHRPRRPRSPPTCRPPRRRSRREFAIRQFGNATYNEATSLVVYDNLGGAHTINLYFTNTGTDAWDVAAFDASNLPPAVPNSSVPASTPS